METKNQAALRAELDAAPGWAQFDEEYVAAARGLSVSKVRAERLSGCGVPFAKEGRRVLYRKDDILAYINGLSRLGPPEARPLIVEAAHA